MKALRVEDVWRQDRLGLETNPKTWHHLLRWKRQFFPPKKQAFRTWDFSPTTRSERGKSRNAYLSFPDESWILAPHKRLPLPSFPPLFGGSHFQGTGVYPRSIRPHTRTRGWTNATETSRSLFQIRRQYWTYIGQEMGRSYLGVSGKREPKLRWQIESFIFQKNTLFIYLVVH